MVVLKTDKYVSRLKEGYMETIHLIVERYNNNDSSRKNATDLHLTSCWMSSRVNLTSKNKAVNLVVL